MTRNIGITLRKIWAWAVTVTATPLIILYIVIRLSAKLFLWLIDKWFTVLGPTPRVCEGKALVNPLIELFETLIEELECSD